RNNHIKIKIHNSATLKTQPTNNPIYKAHLQNIKAQTNNLKKTTRINKTFTITHPQLKTISKTQRFHRQKQSLTHLFF
ncbi:hypothetical protein ACOV25_004580, partial [Escherichia coli]